ncbi:hypothetical protein GCM10010519_41120 [Streptomyces lactacystinicus]
MLLDDEGAGVAAAAFDLRRVGECGQEGGAQFATQPARRRPTNRYTPNNPHDWTPRRQTRD